MRSHILVLLFTVILLAFAGAQAFSQEEMMVEPEEELATEDWLLGDVVAVDLENSQLSVAYADYETDEEKEITIRVDANTGYDNFGSLEKIKVGDVVSIDYMLDPNGEAVALNIMLENSEPEVEE